MRLISLAAAAAMLLTATAAMAEKPADPGGFGRDRAAGIQAALADDTAPGASEMGHFFAGLGGDNGTMNNLYKCANGQFAPTASFCWTGEE